jgi:predicted permease
VFDKLFQLIRRTLYYFRRGRFDNELKEEMRFHLEMKIEANLAQGMTLQEARRAAQRQFGNQTLLMEVSREMWGFRSLETLFQDLRFGLRMLRKNPGFTAVATLSLALGIGANTALFSLVDAVLLKKLPVKEPERLAQFNWQAGRAFRTNGTSGYGVPIWPPGMRGSSSFHYRIFERLREQDSPLSDLFAFAELWSLNVVTDGQAEKARGQAVTGGYYAGLGATPMLGRAITEFDDNSAASPVVVLSHRYWSNRFGADPEIIGKQIAINKINFTVIGVMPPGFAGALQVADNPDVTMPIAFEPVLAGEQSMMDRPGKPGIWWVHLMGRLKPGATLEQAQESLDGAFQSLALEMMPPPRRQNEPAQLEPKDYPHLVAFSGSRGMWEMRRIYSSTIYILLGVVGLVLLIACANVANLLLARAALRGPEITLRLAVGAGRLRLIRQLLTESLLLALLGGAVGILFAYWSKDALAALIGQNDSSLPTGLDQGLNLRVLGFTVAISLATGMLFGLAPAWRATSLDLTTALKEGSRGSSGASRSRLSKALVIAQVAMSLVLLVGAGLFIRTVRNLQQVEVGFNQDNLLLFTVQPGSSGYKDERLTQFYQQLFARLDTLAGARSATFARVPLIAHHVNSASLILPGETAQTAAEHETNLQVVRENYFDTMEIPLLRGRGFSAQDDGRATRVAVINRELARRYFPDEDPIGKRVGLGEETAGKIEIVGIVENTKYNSQREEIEPLIYTSWLQDVRGIGEMHFAVRAAGDPLALAAAAQQAVHDTDSNLPVTNVKTQAAQTRQSLNEERMFANVLSFFGGLALFLAAIGLYGVMAYSVAQRTSEIGIRMALGAQRADVLRLVIWHGMKLVFIGLIIGAIGAFALKKVIATQLYGVQASDPLTFAAVAGLLAIIALLACWIPARRAMKIDPIVALRYE